MVYIDKIRILKIQIQVSKPPKPEHEDLFWYQNFIMFLLLWFYWAFAKVNSFSSIPSVSTV